MNEAQCLELRDFLFVCTLPAVSSSEPEQRFRYLAVTPGGSDTADATIHFAYSRPDWERAGQAGTPEDAEKFLEAVLDATSYKGKRFVLVYHDHLRTGWPIAWGITAKSSLDNFPILVLREAQDGKVAGALMRDSHCSIAKIHTVGDYVEPQEADALIEKLASLAPDELFFGWYKESNISANSIDAAIAMTPESDAGQKEVLVYREMEWLSGMWNNPSKPHFYPLVLSSVADENGFRVSKAKRDSRVGLGIARAKQTIPGDYAALDKAIEPLTPADGSGENIDYEALPAVKALCDWWNAHAPEGMRTAAVFRVYWWNSEGRIFIAGDPEEPALQADQLATNPSFALFERKGSPTVALTFYRGRAENTAIKEGGTQTYHANGEPAWDIGLDLDEVDEAYYSLEGLRGLKCFLECLECLG